MWMDPLKRRQSEGDVYFNLTSSSLFMRTDAHKVETREECEEQRAEMQWI